MKRIISLSLFIFSFFNEAVIAQSNTLEMGIDVAPSLVSLRGNKTLSELHQSAFGFMAGVSFLFHFDDQFSFRTGFAFERKGSLVRTTATDNVGNYLGRVKIRNHYNYITMPLLLRYSFGERRNFFVNAGPYLGYLLNQKSISTGEAFPQYTEDGTANFKRMDAGFSGGLGFVFPVTDILRLSAEARNNLGLVNVSKAGGEIKNNSVNMVVTLAFKLQ